MITTPFPLFFFQGFCINFLKEIYAEPLKKKLKHFIWLESRNVKYDALHGNFAITTSLPWKVGKRIKWSQNWCVKTSNKIDLKEFLFKLEEISDSTRRG